MLRLRPQDAGALKTIFADWEGFQPAGTFRYPGNPDKYEWKFGDKKDRKKDDGKADDNEEKEAEEYDGVWDVRRVYM